MSIIVSLAKYLTQLYACSMAEHISIQRLDAVNSAIDLLKSGLVIALPTDTVYGLTCDATNLKAIHELYNIKCRSKNKPVAICVGEISDVKLWVAGETNLEDEIIQETEAIEEITSNNINDGTTDKTEEQVDSNTPTTAEQRIQKRKEFLTSNNRIFSKKTKNEDPLMMEACNALKTISSQKLQRDSYTLFGEYIAEKLRSYDKRTCAEIQHRISSLIFEADMRPYTAKSNIPPSMTYTSSSPAQWSQNSQSAVSSPAQSPLLTYTTMQSPQSQHQSHSTKIPLPSSPSQREMFSTDVDGTYPLPLSDIATYINTFAEEN